jgi:hypothetical protein
MKPISKSQREIIILWLLGQNGTRYNMATDGKSLYSYDTLIGKTTSNGSKILCNIEKALTWSQKRHLAIIKEEFSQLGNAYDVKSFLQERLENIQRLNVKFKS